jgi:hypothetical protein
LSAGEGQTQDLRGLPIYISLAGNILNPGLSVKNYLDGDEIEERSEVVVFLSLLMCSAVAVH